MKISFEKHNKNTADAKGVLVVGAFEDALLLESAKGIDTKTNGHLSKAINSAAFKGKKDQILTILNPHNLDYDQIIIIGLGNKNEIGLRSLEESGARVMKALKGTPFDTVTINIPDLPLGEEGLAAFGSGIELRAWVFDKYKTVDIKGPKGPSNAIILTEDVSKAESAFASFHAVNEGNFLTRHVVSEPPNVLYPKTMAEQAKALTALGLQVEVLGEEEMRKLGMNALLGVGQGSDFESQLIIIKWNGSSSKDEAPVAIVGKGVTFDSGGISIKPSNNMEDMKYDMGGSGVVLGLMKTLALRKANVNVVGVMGMVENMPSGTAQRPADVVKSMSGQTIEVINTDAEGRLVLADALWYTQDRFKPKAIIDLATLTGAITVALGQEYAGLFSNSDELASQIAESGEVVGEKVWRLPLGKAYDKDIDSDIADMKNVGSGRGAGSITAAQFLQRFVNKTPWVHLDIAGMAWDKQEKPLTGKGATGFGVRLLNTFISRHFG